MSAQADAAPEVAVVIPLVNGLPAIQRCLEALDTERAGAPVEVIVVDRCGDTVRRFVRARFPWVRMIEADAGSSIPELRARGLAASSAGTVAIIEDHCLVCPGWLTVVRDALGPGAPTTYSAVGGPVENAAVERITHWAAFLCEYSGTMPPQPDGEVDALPGNNVAYRRVALDDLGEAWHGRLWEHFWHAELRRRGHRFLRRGGMLVRHALPTSARDYLTQRFLYSRSFAAMRSAPWGRTRRLAQALATLLLPPVLLWRIVREVVGRRRHLGKLVRSLPLLVPFTMSWAAGELVGYLFGPGRSLARVR